MDIPFATHAIVERQRADSFYGMAPMGKGGVRNPKKVAAQFESIFYRILFKQMRDASLGDPFDSHAMGTVKEMRDDEIANLLGATGNLGIKDLVTDFLEKQESEDVVHSENFKIAFQNPQGLLKG